MTQMCSCSERTFYDPEPVLFIEHKLLYPERLVLDGVEGILDHEQVASGYDASHGQLGRPIQRLGAAPTVILPSKPLEEQLLVSEDAIVSAVLEAAG